MADLRVKDLAESAIPGADYYLLTDSATDGVKKIKTSNIITKTDLGLENVDNTSDVDKPVSTATQTALNAKADSSSLGTLAAKNKAAISDINATGTPGIGNYLRGDGQWVTPAGAGDMIKSAYDPGNVLGDAFDRANHHGPIVWPVADKAALKALDTSKYTRAFVVEASYQDNFVWDSSVLIATHQADDFEQTYIAPNPAANGAWVRAGVVQTGDRFTNVGSPRIYRLADRVFVGDAVAYNGAKDTAAAGSWMFDSTGGTATRAYMEASAQFASVSSAGIALTGAARGGPGDGASIGVIGFGMSYGDGGDYDNAFGFYGEGIRGNANASAWAMELNSVNLSVSPAGTNPFTPFGAINSSKPNGLGMALGLTLMAGGDPTVNPTTYDSDVALEIGNNGAKWLTGINLDDNAIYRHEDGRAYAINLARGHMLTWYDDATATLAPAFRIVSVISNATSVYRELVADDSGVGFRNAAGDNLFRVGVTLGTNGVEILPDAAPVITPIGAGADINIILRGKGGAGGSLSSGATYPVIWGNGTLSFHGATPAVQQDVAGSKGGNAALASLLTKLAAIGLITDSTT